LKDRLSIVEVKLSLLILFLNILEPVLEKGVKERIINFTFRYEKSGCSFNPFTSIFLDNMKLGTKPFPGRTYLIPFIISSPEPPGSCY